ncbi:MAG TPA: hypothetical protein PLL77_10390 [Pyrinomonadaceae bacterium]|nr:hypothetical protein [Pyrinomonadaceae bacterium]
MDELFNTEKEKKGINSVFIVGILVGLVLIGGAIWLLSRKPSMEDQTAKILQGSYREDSPEFAELNKDIIISTDQGTVQSPTGMGTISMYINGKIRNKGNKTISALEVNVAVVTQFNDILRERRILVVPVQQPVLGPDQTIPITLTLDGFTKEDDRANIRWKVTAIKAAS